MESHEMRSDGNGYDDNDEMEPGTESVILQQKIARQASHMQGRQLKGIGEGHNKMINEIDDHHSRHSLMRPIEGHRSTCWDAAAL